MKDEQNQANSASSQGRRKFLKGAAAATPVMMTVASRPVLGAQCTPSAWVSGNLSDHGPKRDTCGGRSPGYWKNRFGDWPAGYDPGTCEKRSYSGMGQNPCKATSDATRFNNVFNQGFNYYDGKTLMEVLWLEGNADPHQFGAHIVAMLLNAATFDNYGMTEQQVKDMYNEIISSGGIYTPSVGAPMTIPDVVEFIQNTFDGP